MAWDTEVGRYRLQFPYDRDFIAVLKTTIPPRYRSFEPETKAWYVDELYFDSLMHFLAQCGIQAAVVTRDEVEDRRAQRAASHGDASIEAVGLAFLKLVPYEIMLNAYRQAAKLFHPDRNGGDDKRMTALNAAWSRLRLEFYGSEDKQD